MVVKMAMLAEQRRKKKISLDPRGSSWVNDDSKFGQKLMEKMGWSKGKGLGAKLDGIMEPVKASLKTDNRGVGCSKNHADNWIAHQDDFNALLANLSQDHGGGGNSSEEDTARVSSLEEKSRTSRGRVHYQKFTKGKDLSLKSSSDLDCVFGKRKSQSGTNTPVNQSEANSDVSDAEETKSGLKIVKSSDSIQSYFAKKMAEKKAKLSLEPFKGVGHFKPMVDDTVDTNKDDTETVTKDEFEEKRKTKKKSKKNKKAKNENMDNGIWFEPKEHIDDKKSTLNTDLDNRDREGRENVVTCMENAEVENVQKKIKKSKKRKKSEVDLDIEVDDNSERKKVKKKSKKSKKKSSEVELEFSSSANNAHKTSSCENDGEIKVIGSEEQNVKNKLEENVSESGDRKQTEDLCSKRQKNVDEFLNFSTDAFHGADLSKIKGYLGLNDNVVLSGLKKRIEKRLP